MFDLTGTTCWRRLLRRCDWMTGKITPTWSGDRLIQARATARGPYAPNEVSIIAVADGRDATLKRGLMTDPIAPV